MENLDSEELLHLAVNAIDQGQHDKAISHLKDVTEGDYFLRARYLLAAEYAQIGMYDRAISGMAFVIERDPSFSIASLQKGLLHITRGENDIARETLALLSKLPENDPLMWFGKGLTALLDDDEASTEQFLIKGIELNLQNPALNRDMEKIIVKLKDTEDVGTTENEEQKEAEDKSSDATNKFFLSNYDKT